MKALVNFPPSGRRVPADTSRHFYPETFCGALRLSPSVSVRVLSCHTAVFGGPQLPKWKPTVDRAGRTPRGSLGDLARPPCLPALLPALPWAPYRQLLPPRTKDTACLSPGAPGSACWVTAVQPGRAEPRVGSLLRRALERRWGSRRAPAGGTAVGPRAPSCCPSHLPASRRLCQFFPEEHPRHQPPLTRSFRPAHTPPACFRPSASPSSAFRPSLRGGQRHVLLLWGCSFCLPPWSISFFLEVRDLTYLLYMIASKNKTSQYTKAV